MKRRVHLVAGLAVIATFSLLPAKPGRAIDVYSWTGATDQGANYSGSVNGDQEQFLVTPFTSPAVSSNTGSAFITNSSQGRWLAGDYAAFSYTVWSADAAARDQVLSWGTSESLQPSDSSAWAEHAIVSMYASGPSGSLGGPYNWDHIAGGSNTPYPDYSSWVTSDGYTTAEALEPADYYEFTHGVESYLDIETGGGSVFGSYLDTASGQTVVSP